MCPYTRIDTDKCARTHTHTHTFSGYISDLPVDAMQMNFLEPSPAQINSSQVESRGSDYSQPAVLMTGRVEG